MKPSSSVMREFIEDFSLMNPQGIVNFIADVEIKYSNTISKIKSEVLIFTVEPTGINSVNLLNDEISDLNFPVMFHTGKEAFFYIDDKCLMIIGNNVENGDYVVSLFPEKYQQALLSG